MTSMVEKVSGAMLKILLAEGEYTKDLADGRIKFDGVIDLAELSRAAIEAMRDADGVLYSVLPSSEDEFDQMSGFKQFDGDSGNWFWLWAQAIDAALAESKETK